MAHENLPRIGVDLGGTNAQITSQTFADIRNLRVRH